MCRRLLSRCYAASASTRRDMARHCLYLRMSGGIIPLTTGREMLLRGLSVSLLVPQCFFQDEILLIHMALLCMYDRK